MHCYEKSVPSLKLTSGGKLLLNICFRQFIPLKLDKCVLCERERTIIIAFFRD